jgi:AraC family transcriptional regulator
LAKIAAELDRALARRALHGASGRTTGRLLARGDGWSVEDVICTSGPSDRPFEEQHSQVSIAIVVAGSFQYRSTTGHALMTPGSMMLGNAGQCFECGHEHGEGDRCISFHYAPEYFEQIATDAGASGTTIGFRTPRLPPVRDAASLVAHASAGLVGFNEVSWEELGVRLAARVALLSARRPRASTTIPARVLARVTRTVRAIERRSSAPLTLRELAAEAGVSPYHFLRSFERLTGVTPHQYVRRSRLREAAMRLSVEPAKVIDVAFDSGFADVSNFNRAFRTEFGVSPRVYRARVGARRSTLRHPFMQP